MSIEGEIPRGRHHRPPRRPATATPCSAWLTGPTLRAATGSVLYLALIALLSLGIATAVRDSAVAIGVVLAVLYLFPIIAQVVVARWQHDVMRIGPITAGLSIQATTHLSSLPIGPWSGLGVVAAWAAAALLIGGLALRLRDA